MIASLRKAGSILFFTTALVACGGAEEEEDIVDDGSFDSAYQEGKEDAVRSGKFEYFVGADSKTYFHLLAANGQKVLHSSGYSSTSAAKTGIKSVKTNLPEAARVSVLESANAEWYFLVKAANGETLAWSELYSTKSNAERALKAARDTAKNAGTAKAKAAPATFQIFKGLDSKYYFHVRASNGEILVQSEGYSTRAASVTGSQSVGTNATEEARYQIRDGRSGQFYFVLRAANNKVIAWSELYSSRSNAERARDLLIGIFDSGDVKPAK